MRRAGVRVRLQAQPFRVLALLIEQPGEIVSRYEIVQALWGDDTFVDFDQSVGAVLRRLRLALGDSANTPRYIETLRHRLPFSGAHPHRRVPSCPVAGLGDTGAGPRPGFHRSRLSIGLSAAVALALTLVMWGGRTNQSAGSHRDAIAQRAPAHPRNVEAWYAYQKGEYLWKARTASAIQNSIGYFQQAVNLDPGYAPAYAGLADAYVLLNFYTGRNRQVSIERARDASGRALSLDSSLAEAHAAQAYIKFYYEWDWPGAEKAFRSAIALDPNNATADQWYAEYLFYMERFQEALRFINRAHELDPQSLVINLQLASPLMYSRDYTHAIEKIREALHLNPDFPLAIYMLATCYEQLGRNDDAAAEYRRIAGTRMGLSGLGYIYGKCGRQQEARRILERLVSDSARDDFSAYHVARVYAGLGDAGQAIAWLKKAQRARDERMVMLRVDSKLDALRSDPRFGDLLRTLGLA